MTIADSITAARAAIPATLMQDSGTIRRPNPSDDGAGSVTLGTPTSIAVAACNAQRLSGRELQESQVQQHGSYRLALPITTTIYATDQFVFGGVVYNVVWVPPVSALSLTRIVGLEEAPL